MTLERLWSVVRTILTIIAFIGLLCVARYLLMSTAPMWTDESFALVTSPSRALYHLYKRTSPAETLQVQGMKEKAFDAY